MHRIPVISSNIASIGYDEEDRVLEVEFVSGSIYQYDNIPDYVYEDLMAASSKGRHFYYNIRVRGYPYYRVR